MDFSTIATYPVFLLTLGFVQITSVVISVALAPFYGLAGGRYAILRVFRCGPNRLAIPGRPTTEWPRYFPLAGSPKSAWFVGVLWIMRWESLFEVLLVAQILPVLFIPLQVIVNNVLEEVLSWLEGNGNPADETERKGLPNFFSDPLGFTTFLLLTVPYRIGCSLVRTGRWLLGLKITNNNHAFVNYSQGLDFKVDPADVATFFNEGFDRAAQLKAYSWVLTKAALLSYERLHVVQGILSRDWTGQNDEVSCTSKVVAAWHFDVITSADRDELRDNEHEPTWAETTAMLLSVELQDRPKGRANGKTQTPPIKKALILAFRGTEALKNANWFTDFATAPPKESPSDKAHLGQVHTGFELALGLESRETTLQPCAGAQTSYLLFEKTRSGAYEASRMPNSTSTAWPPETMKGSPYSVITAKILELMQTDPAYELHITGHSLGAALAHLYTAALLVPPESLWNTEGMETGRFKALVTQGQPRLGTYMYNRRLENVLCKAADPTQNKYTRLVNGDDIVCRVPPLQVTMPPFSPVRGMWQHSGHLVLLPVRHILLTSQRQMRVLRMYEQPCSYRMSVLWNSVRRAAHCTIRYVCQAGAGNATLLRTLANWFIVFTVLPLGLGLLLFPPMIPLAIFIIVIGILEAGMLQGISDHGLDGYLNAIKNSQTFEWD